MITWTVAYRRVHPEREPVFHRVNLQVGWRRSTELAGEYLRVLGEAEYEVFYLTSRADELAGWVVIEDVANVATGELDANDEWLRVPIAEDGLPLEALREVKRRLDAAKLDWQVGDVARFPTNSDTIADGVDGREGIVIKIDGTPIKRTTYLRVSVDGATVTVFPDEVERVD